MTDVVLQAPVRGWLTPLEEVPDPVFAERMMGDGLAIDPLENLIRAPADVVCTRARWLAAFAAR
mgnify:CR=1 FL=1